MKIIILGSGASAAQVISTLIGEAPAGVEFDLQVFDVNHRHESPYKLRYNLTKQPHDTSSIEIPLDLPIDVANKKEIWGSFARGGWTNVWGATLFEPEIWLKDSGYGELPSALAGFYINDSKHRKRAQFLDSQSRTGQRREFMQIAQSPLAIRSISADPIQGCNQCGRCLQGCEYGHIWNARAYFESISSLESVKLEEGFAESIRFHRDNVEVILRVDNQLQSHFADMVFCAIGAIQTASLLLRSEIVRTSIAVSDSQMIVMPFLMSRLKKTGSYENRIALSEGVVTGDIEVGQHHGDFFIQLYGYSTSLDQIFCAQFLGLRLLPRFFRKAILSRIGIAMIFLSQEFSGKIILSGDNKKVVQSQSPNRINQRSVLRKVLQQVKPYGLRLLPAFRRVAPIGGGFHFGKIEAEDLRLCYRSGTIKDYNRFSIVDSSSLQRIDSLPITIKVMRNCEAIVKFFLRSWSSNR